jgi:2-polyprenyl-6-hydroxyphenyl methylase/3-demethylubiquinone-9 3-methyltransferase
LQLDAILDVFDAHAELGTDKAALEVGGAPGRYLAYLHRRFGCRCAVVDSSPHGCELTRRNFDLLGIPVDVHEDDVLHPRGDLGRFDLVYSLGLIEHFLDITGVVAAQARLVRPGGKLILGVPNLRGVNGWFARRLAPRRLALHNTEAMREKCWDEFEDALGLEREFRGFVGGFEPGVFTAIEERTFRRMPIWVSAEAMRRGLGRRFSRLRRFNHPAISGYLMGVWRVGETTSS